MVVGQRNESRRRIPAFLCLAGIHREGSWEVDDGNNMGSLRSKDGIIRSSE